jgi:hypothetical protein
MEIIYDWAMPDKKTFEIAPIKRLLEKEINPLDVWIDPFSGGQRYANVTNDLNPELDADYHTDALTFIKHLNGMPFDGVLYDPPYSMRQVKECYLKVGKEMVDNYSYFSNVKDILSQKIKPGGKCISCGWSSVGLGKARGFEKIKILLTCHGGAHNDTITVVERKINNRLIENCI